MLQSISIEDLDFNNNYCAKLPLLYQQRRNFRGSHQKAIHNSSCENSGQTYHQHHPIKLRLKSIVAFDLNYLNNSAVVILRGGLSKKS